MPVPGLQPQVTWLQSKLKPLGQDHAPMTLLRLLYRMRGDSDLALTALTMKPRPQWVEDLCGPLP